MNIERIEVENNKKFTALLAVLDFTAVAVFSACIALIVLNFSALSEDIGFGITAATPVLLSLCAIYFSALFVSRIIKLRRNIIFKADENGICDYSRLIALAPVSYGEIASVEYKGFLSDGVSGLRHLKINLKDNCGYEKKLNFLQKCAFYLGFKQIELHLFCGKAKLKEIAEILKRNLAEYGKQVNNGEAAEKSAGDFPPVGI